VAFATLRLDKYLGGRRGKKWVWRSFSRADFATLNQDGNGNRRKKMGIEGKRKGLAAP